MDSWKHFDRDRAEAVKRIFVVMPAFNESQGIRRAVLEFLEVLDAACKGDFQAGGIVVVDDGSGDETWREVYSLARGEGRTAGRVYGVRLSRNFGKENAILAGVEEALKLGADAVIVADADLQHPPIIMQRMLEAYARGAKIVEGVKRHRGRESLVYRWFATAFYEVLSRLSGLDMASSSDFRLLDREVAEAVLAMPERNTFFRGMSSWVGYPREKVEFAVGERVAGRSAWSKLKLMGLAIRAITSYSSAPLRVVTGAGMLFLVFAVLMAGQTLFRYWQGEAVTGFATVILLILITSSVVMLSLGIIGEYLARIYDEVKGRPRYIASERVRSGQASERPFRFSIKE